MKVTLKRSKEIHKRLPAEIRTLVEGNLQFCEGSDTCMHAREGLDDIIADLEQLRERYPTAECLFESGVL